MKHVNGNVDQMQVFVTISKDEMKINASVNANNLLTKVHAIKDLFGTQVIVSVNAINHVKLENIQTMKIVSVEKGQQIIQLKNVLKTLKKKKQQ